MVSDIVLLDTINYISNIKNNLETYNKTSKDISVMLEACHVIQSSNKKIHVPVKYKNTTHDKVIKNPFIVTYKENTVYKTLDDILRGRVVTPRKKDTQKNIVDNDENNEEYIEEDSEEDLFGDLDDTDNDTDNESEKEISEKIMD
jgi:hypothetical protein